MFDYLIVGCGLFGATFARRALDVGKSVLILDKRRHIGGNCYTEEQHGIQVHKYGPHQFHTQSKAVWDFVNRFAKFNHHRLHTRANRDGRIYSMPPSMILFQQLWGVTTPAEARAKIESVRIPCEKPRNFKEFILDALGPQIYEMFYEGYSRKQWGRDPSEIPMFVARRLPIRFTWNDRYFEDPYEGIPIGGYTRMIENMIDGACVELNTDFGDLPKGDLHMIASKTVYTGKIDALFDYCYGDLEYRSLRFEEEVHCGDFQGNAVMNFTSADIPYTRIVEHKHFEFNHSETTVITKEYPAACGRNDVPFYPVETVENRERFAKYKQDLARLPNIIGGGRLFEYRYYNMDQCIASAMTLAKNELGESEGTLRPPRAGARRKPAVGAL
jgi:UDP-galactopyranose mutase